MSDIVVVGSLNMDLVIRAQRAPAAGETLSADELHTIPGGKGANQAAAIARLGISVAMVGRVGQDDYGEQLVSNLNRQGVDVTHIRRELGVQTGLAIIVVDRLGENRILLISGSNAHVNEEDIDGALESITKAKLLLCQLETLHTTVNYAIETASRCNIPILLNPAPAYPIPDQILKNISYLVLNETEAQVVSRLPVEGVASAKKAALSLCARGVKTVVITLGSQGAVVSSGEGTAHVPGFAVHPIDTTAAGDAFIGGFAVATARGLPMNERLRFANACGALAVTKLGAQTSLPSLEEVESFLQVDHS
jgi:ribokinase